MGVDSGYNDQKTTKKPKPKPKPKPSGKTGRYAARGKDKAVGQTGWDSVARDDLRDAVNSSLRGFDVTVQVKPGSAKKNKASIAKARSAGVNVVVAKGQNQRVAMKEKRHQQNLGCDQPYSAKTEPAAGQPSAGFGSPLGKKNPGAKKNGGQYDC